MTPECRFILSNGRRCRGAALHNQDFCRHHGSRPLVLGRPSERKSSILSPLASWRILGRILPWLDREEIPPAVYDILKSLTGKDPAQHLSDRTAGRFLRALLQRLGEVPFPDPNANELSPHPETDIPPPLAPAPPSGIAQDMRRTLAALPSFSQKPTPGDFKALIAGLKEKGLLAPEWEPAPRPSRP